jgi:methionyl-tRNA formyltransferase
VTTPRPLRVVFFGTPEIAVPTLERLIEGPHDVVGVVSQPDRGRGRGRKRTPSPISEIALRHSLTLIRPERVGDDEAVEALRALEPDLGVVVAFGQFIPKRVRELPSCGYLINAHASLLPKYRGAAPIARAILEGEEETGISVMRVEKEMDAGPVALVVRTPIEEQENTAELSERLARLAADAIAEAVGRIAAGQIEWSVQDASRATEAPRLEKSDAVLDLREDARALARRVHALSPKPGGILRLVWDERQETIKVSRVDVRPFEASELPEPGLIEGGDGGLALRIATGAGWLVPLTLQREGGRPMATADFLRGFALPEEARFALPDPRDPEAG